MTQHNVANDNLSRKAMVVTSILKLPHKVKHVQQRRYNVVLSCLGNNEFDRRTCTPPRKQPTTKNNNNHTAATASTSKSSSHRQQQQRVVTGVTFSSKPPTVVVVPTVSTPSPQPPGTGQANGMDNDTWYDDAAYHKFLHDNRQSLALIREQFELYGNVDRLDPTEHCLEGLEHCLSFEIQQTLFQMKQNHIQTTLAQQQVVWSCHHQQQTHPSRQVECVYHDGMKVPTTTMTTTKEEEEA